MNSFNLEKLLDMLSYRRPHNSKSEDEFIGEFIKILPNQFEDSFGNIIVDVGDSPDKIFSCHTDTVDYEGGRRQLVYDSSFRSVSSTGNDILGADDGVGCFILTEMISSGIGGRYIFHRGEEVGRLGSSFILNNTPKLLTGIHSAIAFDRRGTSDIIDCMYRGRTASPEFISKLCESFGDYYPATGSVTDTEVYKDVIPNCTNISVGYYNEHSSSEWLDIQHVDTLLTQIHSIDWDNFR